MLALRNRNRQLRRRASGTAAVLSVLLAVSACKSVARSTPKVEILEAGESKPRLDHKVIAPDTVNGQVDAVVPGSVEILPHGTDIAARVGSSFGIRVAVRGQPRGSVLPLRARVTHPPLTNPRTSKTTTADEWDNPIAADVPTYVGWGFSAPWEFAPGSWRIELLFEGRPVAVRNFDIRPLPER